MHNVVCGCKEIIRKECTNTLEIHKVGTYRRVGDYSILM